MKMQFPVRGYYPGLGAVHDLAVLVAVVGRRFGAQVFIAFQRDLSGYVAVLGWLCRPWGWPGTGDAVEFVFDSFQRKLGFNVVGGPFFVGGDDVA